MQLDNLPVSEQAFLKACIFGDGWIHCDKRNQGMSLRIGHSVKQLNWLQWKVNRINKILQIDQKILGPYFQQSGDIKESIYESYLFAYSNKNLLKPWFDRWYHFINGKFRKSITSDFLKGMGLQELAVLWCDDGSVTSSNRVKNHRLKDGTLRQYPYVECHGAINLCESSETELKLVSDWILSLTGLQFKISYSQGYPKLRAGKQVMRKFLPILSEYIPDCMSYKVNLSHCRV